MDEYTVARIQVKDLIIFCTPQSINQSINQLINCIQMSNKLTQNDVSVDELEKVMVSAVIDVEDGWLGFQG